MRCGPLRFRIQKNREWDNRKFGAQMDNDGRNGADLPADGDRAVHHKCDIAFIQQQASSIGLFNANVYVY